MALKSFRDRNRIAVGLVSSGTLIALVVGVYLVGTRGLLQDRYTVTGVFADTGGLRSGDEVQVAGIRAGEVTAVDPDFARGRVLVTWKIDGEVDLGPATRAEVRVANLLGGRYLRLSGPVTTPHLADLPDERRRIPLERTSTPTTAGDLLNSSTRTITRLDARSIDRIVSELGRLDARDRGRLGRALADLAELAQAVEESDPQIDKLLTNGERVMDLARTKERQLSQLLTNVQIMLDELKRRRDELSVFLGSGGRTVTAMTRLIDEQQHKLIAVIDDLNHTLGALRPTTKDFNELLAWAGPTLSGLAGAGGYGPWLEVVATGLGPLSPQDLAGLARLLPPDARGAGAGRGPGREGGP
ncbi:phospholipid/cholesterol/gamma-HCH transport system substrate-binding protein [Thermomonospora echinospora]|uniref:Phospholipid/cholesterol/gamma-HCH transport system substrate-binding protein n=1 Tax=Thermomonospora echinospora TaxID=1992 RepID=A0A1H5XB67_9ACTN|nr:MlaD family protein [Thermomonospora echinospora]SEG08893.1 phospholipid/cholesterol/gamma-HCH transport system substrate-binding protein [Thermomonospora echinospora]